MWTELAKVYPNLGIDSYPNSKVPAVEQPTRHALTLGSDPTFVTGWAAGNIVSDPLRRSPAEDLVAQGFGTLRARARDEQAVDARGVYATGTYRVMLRRDPFHTVRRMNKSDRTSEGGGSWPARYEIRLESVLDDRWSEWFQGLHLESQGSETILSGTIADQSALHGILDRVRDLGLSVISVRRIRS